jgi:hypothetical protein
MKNVAATSGQSVSLATAFLVEGNTWEGTCAGSDTVLNFFLSSSYKRSSLFLYAKQAHVLKNTRSARARKKKMHEIKKNFGLGNCTFGRLLRRFRRWRSSARPHGLRNNMLAPGAGASSSDMSAWQSTRASALEQLILSFQRIYSA